MQPATNNARPAATIGQRIAGGLMLLCGIGFLASKLLLPLETGEHWYTGIVANDRDGADHYEVVAREPLARYAATGRLVHTRDTRGGEQTDTLIAVLVTRSLEYRIVAFAPHARFAAVEAELRAMIDSFTLTARKSP